MSADPDTLSTSALAKRLKLPIQQLFVTLRDYGWIERDGESWALTAKGELHGGGYQQSQRFGRYIVWPETLTEHPLVSAIESDQRLSSGDLAEDFPPYSPAGINSALEELGLIQRLRIGFSLTQLGEQFGGRQESDPASGLYRISWPQDFADHPVIKRELGRRSSEVVELPSISTESVVDIETPATTGASGDVDTPDLFADSEEGSSAGGGSATKNAAASESLYESLDGRVHNSALQAQVCDWLYRAQLAHACNRRLPVEEDLTADFYVPALRLCIECWERDVPTDILTRRLRTREVCRESGLNYLEIATEDLKRVNERLTECCERLGFYR